MHNPSASTGIQRSHAAVETLINVSLSTTRNMVVLLTFDVLMNMALKAPFVYVNADSNVSVMS